MRVSIIIALVSCALSACAHPRVDVSDAEPEQPWPRLTQFGSDEAFLDWFTDFEKRSLADGYWSRRFRPIADFPDAKQDVSDVPCDPEIENCFEETIVVTGSRISGPPVSITNNQHAAVDEGDVVKRIGDHLIVLQDGRLFAAAIREDGQATLAFTDRIDVYDDPGIDTWYDEMLVFGRRILVTGYSYERQASVYGIIRVDEGGQFEHEATYLLTGSDYYSSDNYASRIVGDRFITYMPISLDWFVDDELPLMPVMRRADLDTSDPSEPVYADIYRPLQHLESPTLYVVSICDLSDLDSGQFGCEAISFIAGERAEFYVTETHAYLWTERSSWDIAGQFGAVYPTYLSLDDWRSELHNPVYRVDIETGALDVASIEGIPPSQLAINAASSEFQALTIFSHPVFDDDVARSTTQDRYRFVSLPQTEFGAWLRPVSARSYSELPTPQVAYLDRAETRFVGDWLVYSAADEYYPPEDDEEARTGTVTFVPTRSPVDHITLALDFAPLRVDQVNGHPVVTGYRDQAGLRVSWFDLDPLPALVSSTLLDDRYEGESRSHAFNGAVIEGGAIIGLPTVRRPEDAGRWWWESDASDLSFLTFTEGAGLADAGEIAGSENNVAPDYTCEVSCIDWYGNSRPIFTDGRIFALSGAEIAEAELVGGQIREIRRVNLTGAPVH